jgi:ABC-type uncharacterized transport system permease subunit
MILSIVATAILLYLTAVAALLRHPTDSTARGSKVSLVLAIAAVIAHVAVHVLVYQQAQGIQLHFFAALSLVSLGMATLTVSASLNQRLQTLGIVVFPLAALFLALFFLLGGATIIELSWQSLLHATLALLAYATLAIASIIAVMLWFQERALRNRKIHGWLNALPPLVHMETLLFRVLGVGFALLSLVLVTGMLFVEDMLAQHLWHKTVLSALSWIVFAGLLFGRWRFGWRGPRAVRLTLIAMSLLLLSYFGSRAVLEMLDKV